MIYIHIISLCWCSYIIRFVVIPPIYLSIDLWLLIDNRTIARMPHASEIILNGMDKIAHFFTTGSKTTHNKAITIYWMWFCSLNVCMMYVFYLQRCLLWQQSPSIATIIRVYVTSGRQLGMAPKLVSWLVIKHGDWSIFLSLPTSYNLLKKCSCYELYIGAILCTILIICTQDEGIISYNVGWITDLDVWDLIM